MVKSIRRNVEYVLEEVARAAQAAGRSPGEVRLVGVSKFHPLEVMRAAEDTGIFAFGESRIQEAREKWHAWEGEKKLPWHLIGHLQRNKVKVALEIFDCIHSLDSLRLARELERHASESSQKISVLLEVNLSGEEAKYGFAPGEISGAVELLLRECPSLALEGLMTMAPYEASESQARKIFRGLYDLRERLNRMFSLSLKELSMGMSDDYPWAVMEGSTLVRVGTALFGNRE
jgi:pyridoxal phosphate enzyme (YggS family)